MRELPWDQEDDARLINWWGKTADLFPLIKVLHQKWGIEPLPSEVHDRLDVLGIDQRPNRHKHTALLLLKVTPEMAIALEEQGAKRGKRWDDVARAILAEYLEVLP